LPKVRIGAEAVGISKRPLFTPERLKGDWRFAAQMPPFRPTA